MKRYEQKIFFFCISCLVLFFQTVMAAGQTQAPQLHASLRLGIEKALNLELPSATGYFSQAVELDRDDPTGYAFLALSHLLASEMIFDPKERLSHQDSMLSYVDEALTKGQIRIRKNYQDGQVYFAMTMATFVKVSLAIKQKSYLAAAHETSHVWEYVQKTKNANPQGYDIYLPMGLLHYHMD